MEPRELLDSLDRSSPFRRDGGVRAPSVPGGEMEGGVPGSWMEGGLPGSCATKECEPWSC